MWGMPIDGLLMGLSNYAYIYILVKVDGCAIGLPPIGLSVKGYNENELL